MEDNRDEALTFPIPGFHFPHHPIAPSQMRRAKHQESPVLRLVLPAALGPMMPRVSPAFNPKLIPKQGVLTIGGATIMRSTERFSVGSGSTIPILSGGKAS